MLNVGKVLLGLSSIQTKTKKIIIYVYVIAYICPFQF